MVHAKLQDYQTGYEEEDFLKAFTIFGHGGHLGRVTKTSLNNCMSALLKEAPHKIKL